MGPADASISPPVTDADEPLPVAELPVVAAAELDDDGRPLRAEVTLEHGDKLASRGDAAPEDLFPRHVGLYEPGELLLPMDERVGPGGAAGVAIATAGRMVVGDE